MKEKIYIEEAGCNRRMLEIERIRTYLTINGYLLANTPEEADRVLVATCAFKRREEDQSVARLEALQKHADKTIVLGCLPDIAPDRFAQFGDLAKVAPKELEKIGMLLEGEQKSFAEINDSHVLPTGNRSLRSFRNLFRTLRVSSNLDLRDVMHQTFVTGKQKVRAIIDGQPDMFYLLACRGCLGCCSYCAIRRSIGTVKSKPVVDVAADMKAGLAKGYRDFVILGDDMGCYGIDIESSLPELINALGVTLRSEKSGEAPGESDGKESLGMHLREVHPKFLIAYLAELQDGSGMTFVKSLLCPIQSGSNRVLQFMDREHTVEQLVDALKKLRSKYPKMVFSTQIIVGFPGENEAEFRMTLDTVKRIGFDSVVIFPYDDKEGTKASGLSDKVPQAIVRKRVRESFRYFRKENIAALYSCPP